MRDGRLPKCATNCDHKQSLLHGVILLKLLFMIKGAFGTRLRREDVLSQKQMVEA